MQQLSILVKNEKIVQELQTLQLEVEGRKNILSYMIQNDMNHSNNFEYYQKEYFDVFQQYNQKKEELWNKFIVPQLKKQDINFETSNWKLNFDTEEIIVNYEISTMD